MASGIRTQLPTRAELRAVLTAVRRRALTDNWHPSSRQVREFQDEYLLETLADPFESVTDVYSRLGDVEVHLRGKSDRRAVFLTVYTEMTAAVNSNIESGVFDDPEWVREYLVAFADRYRKALVAGERGNTAEMPVPWQVAFDSSRSGYTLLIQDALLGISAHINYDLPYTLSEVGINPNRAEKRRDHDRINEILRQLLDVVQRALADVYDASGYTDVDRFLGSFDEEFTTIGLTEARSLAWRNAVLLTDTRSEWVRRFVDWRIEAVAIGAAYAILAPSADPSVVWALRHIERRDPPIGPFRDAFVKRLRGESPGSSQ